MRPTRPEPTSPARAQGRVPRARNGELGMARQCPACSARTAVNATFCSKCGANLATGVAPTVEGPPPMSPPPAPAPPPYQYPPPPPYQPVSYVGQSKTNGLAVASMVLGILWFWFVGSILALIFGYVSKNQIDKSQGTQSGRGMAVAGIVLGWVGLVGIVALIAAITLLGNKKNVPVKFSTVSGSISN